MIVECSNCSTKYNVDEKRIPAAGVKVKCHKCQAVIFIKPPAAEEAPPSAELKPPPVPQETPSPEVPPTVESPYEPTTPSAPTTVAPVEAPPEPEAPGPSESVIETTIPPDVAPPEPEEHVEPVAEPAAEEMPPGPAESVIETFAQAAPEIPVQAPSEAPPAAVPPDTHMTEEDKKWHERARRLAKALASDLVLYNHDKVEQGLSEGTLAQLLGPEIRRSWEYYCQQIPKHVVDNTDYFKEQLNRIVGKGKEIFK